MRPRIRHWIRPGRQAPWRNLARHPAWGWSDLGRHLAWLAMLTICWWVVPASAVELQGAEFAAQPGNRVELRLRFSGPVKAPESFSTESPARIVLDFEGVTNGLDRRSIPIGVGAVHSLVAVEASNRTRVVVNLTDPVPFQVSANGSEVGLRINTQADLVTAPPPPPRTPAGATSSPSPQAAIGRSTGPRGTVRDIDFRRGDNGEGRVIIKLPDARTRVSVREEGKRVLVELYDTALPQRLFRRLDVTDFGTPVVAVESKPSGRNVGVDIQAGSDFDYMAYQTDDLFTLEFRSLTPAEKEQAQKQRVTYTGERLSLNFQDIEVRAVLQLLADFTGLNLIASDSVTGNVTLRLKNVPWDQALAIILKGKGLAMRQTGNVIMIAPAQELANSEKLELESQRQIEDLAPLRSEYIQINYAKAQDLAAILMGSGGGTQATTATTVSREPGKITTEKEKSESNWGQGGRILSERGTASVDVRTNTLLVQDTTAKLEEVRRIVAKLDVPIRQVMIDSRVVIANNDFTRDLGARFGVSGATGSLASTQMMTGGGLPGTLAGLGAYNAGSFGQTVVAPGSTTPAGTINPIILNPATGGTTGGTPALMVNLPAVGATTAVNFLIGKMGSYLLQLELTAMQKEGRGEIVSSPRVITSDSKQATIKVGQQIPYQTVTFGSTGNVPSTSFKDAVLQLDVTPQITPDDRIIMDLEVRKDSADFSRQINGQPPIDTRSVKTSVLVDNGETVVLGGVFERTRSFSKDQVPWLGDVPIVGRVFRKERREDNNTELLIFVTPKILKGDMLEQ